MSNIVKVILPVSEIRQFPGVLQCKIGAVRRRMTANQLTFPPQSQLIVMLRRKRTDQFS
jgi:hypothetical protein